MDADRNLNFFSVRLHCVIQCVSQSEYQDFGGRVGAVSKPPLVHLFFSTGSLAFEGDVELDGIRTVSIVADVDVISAYSGVARRDAL